MPTTIKTLFACLLVALAAAALYGVRETVRRELPVRGLTYQETLEARSNNAFAGILGEIRATTADFLYTKSSTYHFNGIVHTRPARGTETTEDGTPVIRSRETDFRGLIGYLERQVKPYTPPGTRPPPASEVELLPWYRLMTVVDPSNLNSFITGAYFLGTVEEYDRALEMVAEGIEKNPGHPLLFHLYLSRASIYSRMREFEAGLEAVESGLAWAKQIRPDDGAIGTRISGRWIWSELAEEDFFFLLRYRALFLLELDRRDEALHAALDAYRINPEDVPTSRILERLITGNR